MRVGAAVDPLWCCCCLCALRFWLFSMGVFLNEKRQPPAVVDVIPGQSVFGLELPELVVKQHYRRPRVRLGQVANVTHVLAICKLGRQVDQVSTLDQVRVDHGIGSYPLV